MANERIYTVRSFRSALRRLYCMYGYWLQVLSAVMIAFFSPYLFQLIVQAAEQMSPEIIEAFRQGNNYNIGVLSVPSLDIINGQYSDRIITGVLSGSFCHCLIVVVATRFIGKECSGGYINLAIMHGVSRTKLYAQYIGISAIASALPIAMYPIGVFISVSTGTSMTIENTGSLMITLAVQFIMLLAVSVCFSAIAIMFEGGGATMLGMGTVLVLPLLPNYISIFTGGKVNIEGYMLLSRLVNSGDMAVENIAGNLAVALITAAIFYLIGWLVFAVKNFN